MDGILRQAQEQKSFAAATIGYGMAKGFRHTYNLLRLTGSIQTIVYDWDNGKIGGRT